MKEKNNKKYFFYLALALAIILFFWRLNHLLKQTGDNSIVIGGQKIMLEVAKNDKEHYQGLSGRDFLCQKCGMLFIFKDDNPKSFVMRDMNFPLDIIWLNHEKILKIDRNLSPEGKKPQHLYSSPPGTFYVLEINGGASDRFGFEVNDPFFLKLND